MQSDHRHPNAQPARALPLLGRSGHTPTLDPLARAGLMVRASTNANSLAFEIAAANPAAENGELEGANRVRVAGRARVDQLYATALSRDCPGVRDAPKQWLRIRRVGNAWAFLNCASDIRARIDQEPRERTNGTTTFIAGSD